MPPKGKKNTKKNQKKDEDTTPTQQEEQTQNFSHSVQEEEKLPEPSQTETQTTQPDETTETITEGSQVHLTTEPDTKEPESVIEPTTTEESSNKNVEEEKKIVSEPEAIHEEVVAEPVVEHKEEKHIEEHKPVHENIQEEKHKVEQESKPETVHEPVVEIKEQVDLAASRNTNFGASIIEQAENDRDISAEKIGHGSLESSTKENVPSAGLQDSLREKWEEMHPQKESEPHKIEEQQNVYEKRPSLVVHGENEDIRSDKASDNALQTRLMDDYSETTLGSREPSALELTPEERIRKADERVKEAKALREKGKTEEAVPVLLATFELLNPNLFPSNDQTLVASLNQRIHESTLELADSYNHLNDFTQSIKYARIILKTHPENIRAIYLLGIGLVRIGDLDEAHSLLRESKKIAAPSSDATYVSLIDKELEKLEQIAESKNKTPKASSFVEEHQPIVARNTGSVDEVPEEKLEEPKDVQGSKRSSAAEYFLGSLVSTSTLGFIVTKYLFKFPTRRGLVASLVVGAVVGGVSLIVHNALNKNKKTKK